MLHCSLSSCLRAGGLVLCAALAGTTARAAQGGGAIYAIEDSPDEIHLSDRPTAPPGVAVERIVGDDAGAGFVAADWPPVVVAAAQAQGLDPALVMAVISIESGGQPRAVSPRGAQGLMQLMPATARALGVTDPFDPQQNVSAGARHLRTLLDHYHQDLARALAAYNAGSAVIERLAAGSTRWPSAETAAYVPRVLKRYALLRSVADSTHPHTLPLTP